MYALHKIDLFKREHKSEIEEKFFLNGDLTRKKLFSFLPALILTNLSTGSAALIVSLLQIPIVFFIINTYDLSPDMISLMQHYAIGMMIATPFGMISTIHLVSLSYCRVAYINR